MQRGRDAAAGRFGGAYVGAHGNDHADEAGRARKRRADDEAQAGFPTQSDGDGDGEDDGYDRHGRVLPLEEGHRAFLNRGRDLAHALVAVGLAEHPGDQERAVHDRDDAGSQP